MPTPRSEAARLLGQRLREHRLRLGVSQQDAATLCSLDVANYGRLERGDANPTLETLLHVAATLEADPADLVAGLAQHAATPRKTRRFTVGDYLRAKARHTVGE